MKFRMKIQFSVDYKSVSMHNEIGSKRFTGTVSRSGRNVL